MSRTVYLHGALGSAVQLRGLAEVVTARLGGSYVVPDLPGHGAAAAEPLRLDGFVDFLRDALGDGGDVVGYSMGGYVGLACAAAHPGLVRRLVTIATKTGWTPEVAAGAAAALDPAVLGERAPSFVAALEAQHPGSSAASVLTRTGELLRGLPDAPLPLARVTCPVLVLVGSEDADLMAEADRYVAALPDARLVVLDGAPHAYERMDEALIADLVAGFLG